MSDRSLQWAQRIVWILYAVAVGGIAWETFVAGLDKFEAGALGALLIAADRLQDRIERRLAQDSSRPS